MMTATARKMSLEREHLHYFALIPSFSHFTMLKKKATNKLVCVTLNEVQRMGRLLLSNHLV